MVAAKTGPSATMDVLKEGIKAVAVGIGGSKPIPDELVDPLIEVCLLSAEYAYPQSCLRENSRVIA